MIFKLDFRKIYPDFDQNSHIGRMCVPQAAAFWGSLTEFIQNLRRIKNAENVHILYRIISFQNLYKFYTEYNTF